MKRRNFLSKLLGTSVAVVVASEVAYDAVVVSEPVAPSVPVYGGTRVMAGMPVYTGNYGEQPFMFYGSYDGNAVETKDCLLNVSDWPNISAGPSIGNCNSRI